MITYEEARRLTAEGVAGATDAFRTAVSEHITNAAKAGFSKVILDVTQSPVDAVNAVEKELRNAFFPVQNAAGKMTISWNRAGQAKVYDAND